MSTASVSVVDYGLGNLGSVLNMFRRIDVEAELVREPEDVVTASRLLLPGVGSFDAGVAGLAKSGLGEALVAAVRSGTPVLGICLGMQLLTHASEEGEAAGLGLLDASCVRLQPADPALRIPHMGWNWVTPTREHALVDALPSPAKFYFAHSYKLVPQRAEDALATTDFGGGFTSMMVNGNVCGAQFHPEKSHVFGMSLLGSFAEWKP
jgi:glutamine amidotransferase